VDSAAAAQVTDCMEFIVKSYNNDGEDRFVTSTKWSLLRLARNLKGLSGTEDVALAKPLIVEHIN